MLFQHFLDDDSIHRLGNILQRLRTHIVEGDINLAADLPLGVIGNADAAGFRNPFEPRGDVDAVAKDIVVVDNDVADVDADAKLYPPVLWGVGIVLGHVALDFQSTSRRVHRAGELNESAVPGILDDASAMMSDFGIEKRLSKSFQLRQRAFFVDPH